MVDRAMQGRHPTSNFEPRTLNYEFEDENENEDDP
jgi:hypothetical protein